MFTWNNSICQIFYFLCSLRSFLLFKIDDIFYFLRNFPILALWNWDFLFRTRLKNNKVVFRFIMNRVLNQWRIEIGSLFMKPEWSFFFTLRLNESSHRWSEISIVSWSVLIVIHEIFPKLFTWRRITVQILYYPNEYIENF